MEVGKPKEFDEAFRTLIVIGYLARVESVPYSMIKKSFADAIRAAPFADLVQLPEYKSAMEIISVCGFNVPKEAITPDSVDGTEVN